MKDEYKLQLRMFVKLLWVCGFAFLYALGGIQFKWLRRFIAPAWLTGGMFLFSRDWRVFLQAPLLMAGLSLGYGAENFWPKVIKRFIFGAANGATAITHIFDRQFNKRDFWVLFALNIILCVVATVLMGVFNPVPARTEELIIGFTIGFISMFMPREKT